ncbi:hypothetical protein NHX12_021185 [Muraenolepis orangiensis]|uniref:Ig-like domain-containing protein n=1 Tax=Muraenolepis orangiensis TaxID=630683 RepID=A0A9Q0IU86_9TELE|nr:hypothetical protein NHX12_021185 [Muraenolepis orangiensis]
MASVPKGRRYFMVLCIFLPFFEVSVQERGAPITVSLEEGMTLDCLCPWSGSLSMVMWTKSPDEKTPIAVFHPDMGKTFSWRYRQRVEFPRATPLDGSMVLTNVTHQDLGVYHCTVTSFPLGTWSREVTVEDQDLPPIEKEDDGQPPEADVEVTAMSGEDVTLPCSHDDDNNNTNGMWTAVRRVWVERYVQDHRGYLWSVSLSVCSLRLQSVTPEHGGFYRCRFVLTVRFPDGFNLSDYMMYIYIGSGAACFLLLLSVFSVLLARYRNYPINVAEEESSGSRYSSQGDGYHQYRWGGE